MTFAGTDEDAIIDIVAQRSNAQRQEIRQTFKSLLGRVGLHFADAQTVFTSWASSKCQSWLICPQDLMKDLKSELSKNLERLIIGLMLTPAEFDAKMMKKAMEVRMLWIIVRLHARSLLTLDKWIIRLFENMDICGFWLIFFHLIIIHVRVQGLTNTLLLRSWSPGAMLTYKPWMLLIRLVRLVIQKEPSISSKASSCHSLCTYIFSL